MAVGFPTKANWAAGDILTAAQMDDLAGTVNLLSTTVPRNPILNSNYSVWQRGTSIACTSTAYTADRWNGIRSVAGSTVSRQATGDTTNLPNIQYCARVARDSGNTSTSAIYFAQSMESVNSIPYAGKTVVFSFYARAGANYSAASSALAVSVLTGTGTDQNFATGSYTGAATPISGTATLTTTWQRFQYTATLATTATEIGFQFAFTPVGTAGANDYFEVTGVQLELGSTASTYYPNGATYQAELAACQRYCVPIFRTSNIDCAIVVSRNSTTAGEVYLQLPVMMRTLPSLALISGNYGRCVFYDTLFNVSTSNVSGISVGDGGSYAAVNLLLTHGSVAGTSVTASWDTASNGGVMILTAEL